MEGGKTPASYRKYFVSWEWIFGIKKKGKEEKKKKRLTKINEWELCAFVCEGSGGNKGRAGTSRVPPVPSTGAFSAAREEAAAPLVVADVRVSPLSPCGWWQLSCPCVSSPPARATGPPEACAALAFHIPWESCPLLVDSWATRVTFRSPILRGCHVPGPREAHGR